MDKKNNLIDKMKNSSLKVEFIDKENMTFHCSDGNDYPLFDDSADISVEELQECLDKAKDTVINLLQKFE